MIKVNLLRDQSAKKLTRRKGAFSTFTRLGFMMAAGLIILLAGMGSWWYYLDKEISQLTENRQRLRIEFARLQSLKKQIVEFENLKKLQESRIQVIEQLKNAQTGPVLLLNHVIQSIPRDSGIWLTSLDQKGDRIVIVGYTKRAEYVPDFMTNLSATRFFKSVDLEIIVDEKDASRFSLVCMAAHNQPKA